MRLTTCGIMPTILLFLVASVHAGLVHRQNRNANLVAASALELATGNLIPVQIIQDDQQLKSEKLKVQSEPQQLIQTEQLKSSLGTPEALAEKIAQSVETVENLQNVGTLLENERLQDEKIIEQEIKQAIAEENRELLQAAAIVEQATQLKTGEQFAQQAQEINAALKTGIPAAAEEAAATYFSAPDIPAEVANSAEEVKSSNILQSASLIADNLPAESQSQNVVGAQQLVSNEADKAPVAATAESASVNQVRQAVPVAAVTEATSTQTTTQQNFVQQLIQNSPLGQFFGQLTGQQQQQLAAQGAPVAADQPATPAPTLPGFLNPQNAITQVQNAAQSVANATAQAFQGVQQFATSLGSQFQNTLSGLSGQAQTTLSTSDSTTQRPPGPIQSLLSNFVGGNQPAGAAAATAATANPAQQQGPFQGIISFLQGGNRPQTSASTSGTVAAVAPAPAGSILPASAVSVDENADEVKKDELLDAAVDQEQAQIDQTDNEVRNSAEVGDDSLEDSNQGQFIIVNDDASQQ
ncbi:20-hydroxyecdysone protein [Anastrepha obliqua]|uniref:20-hydroxyecdysone protein n=1 Tax=Anastrepha obliqua TaxID=95512 RepID=UPI002409C868|nr:20-hydroxyecdysone protein [Anastrepha obliqua]